jgi:uncharacterized membrane protein
VPPLALALVGVAAVLHAAWNILLKTSGDTLRTALRLQVIGTSILVPIAVVAWLANSRPSIPSDGLGLAFVSGILEALYFIFLAGAYRRGDLSLVYPLARGSAPLLAVIVGVGLLGEHLDPLAAFGVVLLLIGIMLTARPWRVLREAGRGDRGAVIWALATGATIAAYSSVDRVGVRTMQPWLYGAILAVFAMSLLAVFVFVGRRVGIVAPVPSDDAAPRRSLARDAIAGVMSLSAYLLILIAHSIAPLAAVAPLRESAIVLAAAWGAIRLGEASSQRETALRIGAAVLVVVGALFLAIG